MRRIGGENCALVDDQSLGGQGLLSLPSSFGFGGIGFLVVGVQSLKEVDVLAHAVAVAPDVDHVVVMECTGPGFLDKWAA